MSAEEAYFDFDDERGLTEETDVGLGIYHMVVDSVEEHAGNDNCQLEIKFRVLSPGDFQGAVYTEWIPQIHDDWARKKRYKIAIVLGLTTLKDLRAGGVRLVWKQAIGRECIVELIKDAWTDKKSGQERWKPRSKWPDNFYSATNKQVISSKGVRMAGSDEEDKVSSEPKPVKEAGELPPSGDSEVPF